MLTDAEPRLWKLYYSDKLLHPQYCPRVQWVRKKNSFAVKAKLFGRLFAMVFWIRK